MNCLDGLEGMSLRPSFRYVLRYPKLWPLSKTRSELRLLQLSACRALQNLVGIRLPIESFWFDWWRTGSCKIIDFY